MSNARAFFEGETDFGSEDELDAECRLLGTMLKGQDPHSHIEEPLPPIAFCTPFHAAAYYAVLCLRSCGRAASPDDVWSIVRIHKDADTFGVQQLRELSDQAASAATFYEDKSMLLMRAASRCMDIAVQHGARGALH